MTPREIARRRAIAEAGLAKARAEVSFYERELLLIDELAGLHSRGERSSIDSKMQSQTNAATRKKRGTNISRALAARSAARDALDAHDMTPATVAAKLSVSRPTVQAWLDHRNAISRAGLEFFRKLGVPDSFWRKVQD